MDKQLFINRISKSTAFMFIVLVLSSIVIYQGNVIHLLRDKQISQFFLEAHLSRDQKDSQTLATLKTLMDDEKVTLEMRNEAVQRYTEIAVASNNETKIETILKSKGYEDVLCFVAGDKVRVIIRSDRRLGSKKIKEVEKVVISIVGPVKVEVITK